MRVDKLLMDLRRSEWLMSLDGVMAYAHLAHKIISGESISIIEKTHSLVTIIDDNGKTVNPNKDGILIAPKGSVAVVDMIGPVLKYGDMCTYGADEIAAALFQADRNPNIKATVFNIDGPGGGVNAIAPLIDFGKKKTKPVVGLADQCASLHFWALCAVADHRMASNDVSAMFGSVGVVLAFMDAKKVMEKMGYVFHEIYPEESEHKNENIRLALEGKYELIKKESLSPLAIKFQDFVINSTPNLKQEVGVLTGKTFTADQALKNGMINSIGSLDDALQKAHILSEINHYK